MSFHPRRGSVTCNSQEKGCAHTPWLPLFSGKSPTRFPHTLAHVLLLSLLRCHGEASLLLLVPSLSACVAPSFPRAAVPDRSFQGQSFES